MGVTDSVIFSLVEATPYRLRYLMETTGGVQATILPNAAGGTPDLRTDADHAAPGSGRNPILEVVSTAVADQAEARSVMFGDDSALNPVIKSHVKIAPRDFQGAGGNLNRWRVDADEGASAGDPGSAGFPVLIVDVASVGGGNPIANEFAYLDIFAQHSIDGDTR